MTALAVALLSGDCRLLRAETAAPRERQKIERLIQRVASAKDLQFVRNGKAYNADAAATFLRRKWEANDSEVKSARDFIEKIASFSGTSGKPYLIRLKNGSELKSRDYLLEELRRIEESRTAPADAEPINRSRQGR